jgi:hypothetical protein
MVRCDTCDCQGVETTTCGRCNGSGICTISSIVGPARCVRCDGLGKTTDTCSACGDPAERKYFGSLVRCYACNATGLMWPTCKTCNGKGTTTCTERSGGKDTAKCAKCSSRGTITCGMCEGKGTEPISVPYVFSRGTLDRQVEALAEVQDKFKGPKIRPGEARRWRGS